MTRYAFAALLFAVACDAALVPNDDGGQDSGQDSSVADSGRDAATEAGPSCECTSGACCDGCHVMASGAQCGPGVHDVGCTADMTTAQDATWHQTCDGASATGCGGAWVFDPATIQSQNCRPTSWCIRHSATFPYMGCCSSAACP